MPTFTAPENTFNTIIQSKQEEQPKEEKKRGRPKTPDEEKIETTRMNAVIPLECYKYLREMGYKTRSNLSRYLVNLIKEDMEKHPNWKENLNDGK